ncbi:uncharacterized protein LOC133796273 [Humulus lupulus]|uniref:uncharacterized protein LOC133796273 n=1 Tax=Humulus lupulus TaxID=3486 RepID=UPI002B406AAC|nr:uncharacterized protein LOC133796273 [Humulus lupulus]
MVKTRGTSSKKTPTSQSRKVPYPSPPPSVSMAPPSVTALATSVGKTSKSKVRKKVFSLCTEHPMVFPNITVDIVNVAPPSEMVVPSRANNLSPLPIESSLTARAKSKSVSSSSKAATARLLKLPMKPSQSKKNYVAPKRKLGLDSSSSPLTAAKKKLKAHLRLPPNLTPRKQNLNPVATPLSSKAKGKRPIFDSTPSPKLSGVNFKPYSSTLCYNDNARSLVKFTGFVDRIVKEFYTNLTDEIIEPKSPLYCKVFVRGHWFSFSPQDIAHALHLPLVVEDDDDLTSLDKDAVITELVGQKMVWPYNTIISVTNLTYTYAVLHKFATMNWKPTSHTATISFDMASFLYKVGTGIGINLAMFIYDQIIGFRKGNRRNLNLPFPQVIYKALSMQKKNLQRDQEDLVAFTTTASYKASATTTEAIDAPSTKKFKPQSLKFASNDIPHASSSTPTDSGLVATELAAVRASVDSLAARVMSIEGLQRSVLDAIQTFFQGSYYSIYVN